MTAPITAITLPKWGLTMTEGKVVQWLKQPGASFAKGEELLEIETSKITNVVEADAAGTLTRIVAPEGTTLPIGALLAVIAPADTPAAEIDAFVAQFVVAEPADAAGEDATPVAPRELQVLGRTLRCLELGSGDAMPVLLLHGFGADLNSWMFNQPALCEGRRTLALELPGHGLSSKDVGGGDATFLTDVVEAALTELGAEQVHIVGHSMGGALAVSWASRRPDRIASLTLLAPAGLGPEINGGFIDAFVRASRRREAVEALQLLVHDPTLISRAMVEDFLRYKRLDGVTPALETMARAWFPEGRQAVDLITALRALAMPVQVIWGRDDKIIPVAHAAAAAPSARIHVLEGVGHLPHMEKAGEVNRLIGAMIA
ncbi:MAG TPA: acetoin dehydrogenase dihydrolipoyllysine-residue acetyltransferase subunit [Acetobacteraceae bacterium]|nr:acetoin dehydrogenase dihydrolipoyllysine-residue acetyltransferase subunit [Acetobacteraceae bacterium]